MLVSGRMHIVNRPIASHPRHKSDHITRSEFRNIVVEIDRNCPHKFGLL